MPNSPSSQPEHAKPAAEGVSTPPLSIVTLDDDPDFRQYLATLLESEGHSVRAAANSAELLTMCQQDLPEVVLLDMKMGRESGEEVLEEIRKRWPRLCVIVVTGYPSMDSMRQTFRREGGGVFDYIAKPFSITQLRESLSQAATTFGLGWGGRKQDKLRHELGRQIRLSRAQRGWTLKELSEASGVSVSQLSSIERGSHMPSLESLLDIAGALEQRPSAWFGAAGF